MPCDNCSANFTLFRLKKLCVECQHYYCSACIFKEVSRTITRRRCNKCRVLTKPNFSRHDLMQLKVRDLRQFLTQKNIGTNHCKEKNDLVELILCHSGNEWYAQEQAENQRRLDDLEARKQQHGFDNSTQDSDSGIQSENNAANHSDNVAVPNVAVHNTAEHDNTSSMEQNSQESDNLNPDSTFAQNSSATHQNTNSSSSPSTNETQSSHSNGTSSGEERLRARQRQEMEETLRRIGTELLDDENEADMRTPNQRAQLDDITEENNIPDLTVKQLKEILITNFVDYKGCVEKWELEERVRRLWLQKQDQKKKSSQSGSTNATNEESSSGSNTVDLDDNDMCKICMDAHIDCVLLECGHMITCTKCGKRLAECPICRQFVTRAIHIFKA
ncbi:unnamed protein product [Owenia fusiformis]|uniref:Uncharacterized protein n=1 Tax=Owenia fusiformis TaxID=6347 RepID=A0A8J1XLM5_OWEFU|nr:unnamed protein product [Owenia fusiformis]